MASRRKPTVKFQEFTRDEQVIICQFLTNRNHVVQHALAVAREMRLSVSNAHTDGQLKYEKHRAQTMAWLLSSLPLFRKAFMKMHGSEFDDHLLERIYQSVNEEAA